VDRVLIPSSLDEAIENERDALLRAESIIICMKRSLELEEGLVKGPYYPDVIELVRELVRKAFNGLDSVNLRTFVRP
jgi:hypothetical protein